MKKVLLGSIAAVALWSGGANAADLPVKAPPPPPRPACSYNDIVRANNQVSVDFVDNSIHYGPEYLTGVGAPLDKETGWVPGFDITGSVMRNAANICNLYLWGRFTYGNGHTAYYGSVIGGAFGSLQDQSGATVNDFDFRLGKGFNIGPKGMITPYFGIGSNWWDRALSGPGGYNEDYKHDYAGAGLLLQYSPAPRWVLSANGLIGGSFDASETTSPIPGELPATNPLFAGSTTFNLGNRPVYMAGGAIDYAFTQHWHGNAGIDYIHFAYGQSPANAAGYLEPNSNTSYLLVSVGAGYSW